MANHQHVDAAKRGPVELDQFRTANPGIVLDLSDADFRDIDLTRRNLSGANLRGANLTRCRAQNANFTGADLASATLSEGRFNEAIFTGADLSNCVIRSAGLENADLRNANLSKADCTSTNLQSVDLRDANTNGTTFAGSVLDYAKISLEGIRSAAELKGTRLRQLDLNGIDLSGHDLERADFVGSRLTGANFSRARLIEAQFATAILKTADFSDADLTSANFGNADLTGANFANAKLARAVLQSAVLNTSTISGADFYEANLTLAAMEKVKGAYDAQHLLTTRVEQEVLYFPTVERRWQEWLLDWERIRVAGRLPLLGVSYTGLITIPIYVYLIGIYNDNVELARTWVRQLAGTPNGPTASAVNVILEHLHEQTVPSRFFILFLSTMCLAAASTIYAAACPSRVKSFSRDQWCDELGHSLVHYWPEAWRKRGLRIAAAILYALGGIGALYAVSGKLWQVAVILYNSPFPFW